MTSTYVIDSSSLPGLHAEHVSESKAIVSIYDCELVGYINLLSAWDIAFIATHPMLDSNIDLWIEFSQN